MIEPVWLFSFMLADFVGAIVLPKRDFVAIFGRFTSILDLIIQKLMPRDK